MPRLSPVARREAIVAAALDVARRKGLGATTARDVAAEMRTSSGLIHHYFASMDDLMAAVFVHAIGADLAELESAVAAAELPVDQLRAFFGTYARFDAGYQLWLDAWAEASRRPALREASQRLNVAWQTTLQSIIERGVADSAFTCADPGGAAWRILSLLDGLALQVVAHPRVISEAKAVPWVMAVAEFELGLAPGILTG